MSKLSKYLRKQKVKHLRLTWCDNANIIRAQAFSIEAIDEVNHAGIRASQAIQAVPVMHDRNILEAKLPPAHDIILKPDWLSFHLLPYTEASACVMSRMTDHAIASPLCPRQLLTTMTQRLFEKTGLTLQIAFDQTFQLLDESEYVMRNSSQRSLDTYDLFLTDLVEIFKTINMQPSLFHAATGMNRFKLSFRGLDPLVAADNQVMLRQIIHGVAMKYSLQSSFLPVLSEEDEGNGSVLQFNLFQNAKNVTFDKENLSTITTHFMAGLLYHLPDLLAFTTPTQNSLRRMKTRYYSIWGYDHREAAIEVPKYASSGAFKKILFKIIDATANPYYAASAVIAAGIDGIEKKMLLPKPTEYDHALLAKHDNSQALPRDLGEILKSIERSPLFREMMGEKLFNAYLTVKKAEYAFFKEKALSEEVALLKFAY